MKAYKRIYIEITDACNLSCSFCPQVAGKTKFMKRDMFEKIIDEAKEFTAEVSMHVLGEPFLNPDLVHFTDYAVSAGMDVVLTTNGTLLNTETAFALAERRIKQINISLHSERKPRKFADTNTYLKEVFDFIALVRKVNSQMYFNLRLWNILSEDNQAAVNELIKHFKTEIKMPDKLESFKDSKSIKLAQRIFLHLDTRFIWPDINAEVISKKGSCYGLDSHYGVLASGRIIPCCLDEKGILELGNCNEVKLTEALNSKRAAAMLKGFQQNILVEDLCQRCDFITRFSRQK